MNEHELLVETLIELHKCYNFIKDDYQDDPNEDINMMHNFMEEHGASEEFIAEILSEIRKRKKQSFMKTLDSLHNLLNTISNNNNNNSINEILELQGVKR